MIRDEVSISMETYTTVVEKENLGEPHTTLGGGEMWYSPDEVRTRDVRVLNELRQQGLVDGTRVSDRFMDALAVMQRPSVEYYTFASIDGRSTTIRTAALGRDAVLVIRQGQRITIAPIPVEQLGLRLAAALPTVPAAPVHSMSCDDADLRAVMKDKAVPSSKSAHDAKRMKRILEGDRADTGQLYAAIRDGVGGRKSTTAPIPTWFDTEQGRLLLSFDTNGWVNLTGATTLTIADKLADLEKALGR